MVTKAGAPVVYFSSATGNTRRLVEKVGYNSVQIPLRKSAVMPVMTDRFVLFLPTYSDAYGKNSVPKPVIRFLNILANREWLAGVIGSGNRNFGDMFAIGGRVVAEKCNVPLLYRVELAGTSRDVDCIKSGIGKFLNLTQDEERMEIGNV